jgi:pilus assembly protein TadC
MPFSEILRHVALVITDVSEELSASIIRVIRIGELGTLAVTRNRRTLRSDILQTEFCRPFQQ